MTLDLSALRATNAEVARLSRPDREDRLDALLAEAHAILDYAIDTHVTGEGKELAATAILFSGGNDSTILAHVFKDRATHAAHANTGVGVEETREYVRKVCQDWGLPLIERMAPRMDDRYRQLVLSQGFPGPGHHYKMFQRLKERALRTIRKELMGGYSKKRRIVFLAGRRRDESARRTNVPELEREGAIVWVSPLVNWTKTDMNTYRLRMKTVPVNQVSDVIHMSGECLCGSFAKEGEREEIEYWYPRAFDEIRELEEILAGPGYEHIPDYKKTWGWGWDAQKLKRSRSKPSTKTGMLCSSCVAPPSVADEVIAVGVD